MAGATPDELDAAIRADWASGRAVMPAVATAMQDELDQKPRLARFREQHPGVLIEWVRLLAGGPAGA